MAGSGPLQVVDLSPALRAELEHIVRDGPEALKRRAYMVLARADGASLNAIADSVNLHRDSVRRWLIRFGDRGLAGLRHGNAGKPKNVVFGADVCREILRRANLPPAASGEPFPSWSLYKLREHVMREGLVGSISIERLRQLINTGPCSRQYWHQPTPAVGPLPPDVRDRLLELAGHPRSENARRARAVLAVADGASITKVAGTLHLRRNSISRWLDHFRLGGIAGLTAPPEAGSPTPATNAGETAGSVSASNGRLSPFTSGSRLGGVGGPQP